MVKNVTNSINRTQGNLFTAIVMLHRKKDAGYGPAWKNRGEVISILANVARKIDRLEHVTKQCIEPTDETLFDTVIDLFVYCIKFQTFLADTNSNVASRLFERNNCKPPYSDGTAAFENVLSGYNLERGKIEVKNIIKLTNNILRSFSALENCYDFENYKKSTSPLHRFECVRQLTDETLNLLQILAFEDPKKVLFLISKYSD